MLCAKDLFGIMTYEEKRAMTSWCLEWKHSEEAKEAREILLTNEEKLLVSLGQNIAATKAVRERTGKSLATSKYAVDIHRGLRR